MNDDAKLMTYNMFTFKTEPEMRLHMRYWEDNGLAVYKELKLLGCTRFCYNRIWNKQGTFKTSVLFEYANAAAFKKCQQFLESGREKLIKEIGDINVVIEASRNIVLQDLH